MKRMAFIIALAGLVSQGWGGWRVEEILAPPGQVFYTWLTMGIGRNDDTNRIYCMTADTSSPPSFVTIQELTYSDKGWNITPVCSLPPKGIRGITLADGRNDGITRLYAVIDSSIYEFSFSNGWKIDTIIRYHRPLYNILAAPAHNDDTVRLYSGIPGYRDSCVEFTCRAGVWKATDEFLSYGGPQIAGTGRNDDTIRLYCGRFSCCSELTYRGGVWVGEGGARGYVMGDGRNDSVMRIYGWGILEEGGEELWENTYNGTKWEWEVMGIIEEYNTTFCIIGDGRNTGKNQVYWIGEWFIYEYEWKDGEWEEHLIFLDTMDLKCRGAYLPESLLSWAVNTAYWGVIGRGRNDDTNRVYAILKWGEDDKIIELTYIPEGVIENKPQTKEIPSFSVYPNPAIKFPVIKLQLPVKTAVSLKVYDISGRLVRILTRTKNLGPGTYTLHWDGKDSKGREVGEGVYFCVLKTPSHRITEKIVIK